MRSPVVTTALVVVLLLTFVAVGFAAKCPKCGTDVPAGAKFCPNCGEKVAPVGVCPQCGTKIPEGAKFCPNCGAKVGAAAPAAGQALPAPGVQPLPAPTVERPKQRYEGVFPLIIWGGPFMPPGQTDPASEASKAWQLRFLNTIKGLGFNGVGGGVSPSMAALAEQSGMYVIAYGGGGRCRAGEAWPDESRCAGHGDPGGRPV